MYIVIYKYYMAEIVRYSNIQQQNVTKNGVYEGTATQLAEQQGVADVIREEMLNTYGWQSPSEYYYGTAEKEVNPEPSDSMVSLGDLQDFGKDTEAAQMTPADKNVIPDWFWVDSLDNWCYFKITDDMTEFKKTSPRFGEWGNLLLEFASAGIVTIVDDVQKGDWWKAGLDTFKTISMISTHEKSIKITEKASEEVAEITADINKFIFGDNIVGNALATLSYYSIVVPSRMLATASTIRDVLTLPILLYNLLSTASSLDHEDVEAEPYPEMLASKNTENNMPRNCISMYMWNGYRRNWMPVKTMFEIYERYGKRSSRDIVASSLQLFCDKLRNATDDKYVEYLQVYGIIIEDDNIDDRFTQIRNAALDIKHNTTTDNDFVDQMTELLYGSPECVNALSRLLFLNIYGFDPRCFEAMEKRALLNKKHVIHVDNEDSHSWSESHWLENWSMWISLPRDKCKIKLYNKNTYQIINRPYQILDWNNRDLVGYEHKNIGHPCFMRGNDDLLWLCYWQRWTSTRGTEESGGTILDKTITVGGIQDIFKDDVDNWTAIREAMFEKHDDYGFDDWMINGNYLLSNHRFTIDEESPTSISTYEESTIAPDKVAPVNSIDDVSDNALVLKLSTGTVISRDNDNGMLDVAKRWR